MPKRKVPGPDGFPPEFFLESWELVGEDTISAIIEFFIGGRMLNGFKATAIAVIQKISGADRLTFF